MTPQIQEWIHKFEVGEGTRLVRLVAVALSLLALVTLYDLREYRGFATEEAMDAAQLASNLAEGKGYTTMFIRPLSLHLLQERAKVRGQDPNKALGAPHPDLANAPVYPMLLAGLMKIIPMHRAIPVGGNFTRYQPEVIIALANQLLLLMAVWMVFLLARRLFDEPVAWIASIIMAGSDALWRFTISGAPTVLLLLLVVGLLHLMVRMEEAGRSEDRSLRWWLLSSAGLGLLMGVGMLTRYSFGWLVLPVAGFGALYFGARRRASLTVMLVVMGLVVVPWLWRNYELSGRWFGVAGYAVAQETEAYPSARLMRSLEPGLDRLELDHYFRKLVVNGSEVIQSDLPRLGSSWLVAFFLPALLVNFRNPALGRLRWWVLGAAMVLVPIQAMGRTHLSQGDAGLVSENCLIWLVPAVFIYGAGFYYMLADQLELSPAPVKTALHGVFCVVSCSSLIVTLLPPKQPPQAYPPYWPPLIQQVGGWMRPGELMMSDIPWAIAWYARTPCMWTVLDVEKDFLPVNDFQKPIQALYLTQVTTDARFYSEIYQGLDQKGWEWFMVQSLLRTNLPPKFPLRVSTFGFPPGQLYLTDYQRW